MAIVPPRLFFDANEVDGIGSLLTRFGPGAFASPHRSTIPLVALVKDDWPIFSAIATACESRPEFSVHFEYKIAPPGAEGNPSQTDAMVLSPTSALAIEAKWTEPRYETVSVRLRTRIAKLVRDDPDNAEKHDAAQRAVVEGWLGLLRHVSNKPIRLEDVGEAVYQTLHRAASACAISRPPSLVYLHFDPSPARGAATMAQYRADLQHLHRLLGNPLGFPFHLVALPLRPTVAFLAIESLPKRGPDTDRSIRNAVRSTRLFEFGDPQIEKIG